MKRFAEKGENDNLGSLYVCQLLYLYARLSATVSLFSTFTAPKIYRPLTSDRAKQAPKVISVRNFDEATFSSPHAQYVEYAECNILFVP